MDDSSANSDDEEALVKKQWADLRQLLKTSILSNEIPVDPTAMKPKPVWEMLKQAGREEIQFLDYNDKAARDKFQRMLRTLRKLHKDGDLENEGKGIIVWSKSAAKQYLRTCFKDQLIPADYEDPQLVWNEHCAGERAFARMSYDAAFVRRLASVRDDYLKKKVRCEKDLEAYKIAKQNHPTPEFNCRGEPHWNGSKAQQMLKEMVGKGLHEGKDPIELWADSEEYSKYSLTTFRDHIYQEERLIKFDKFLKHLKKRKLDKLQY